MIIAITDRHALLDGVNFESHILELLSSPADYVLLREPDWGKMEFNDCLSRLHPSVKAYWHKLILPLHEDLVSNWGVDGIHLKSNQHLPHQHLNNGTRSDPALKYSGSVHSLEALINTNHFPWRFRFISPVATTSCKPDAEPLCSDTLKKAIAHSTSPLVALGGISLKKAEELRTLGFKDIALRSYIMSTKDPNDVIRHYRDLGF
jgi:thiamine monophosphate synthase